VQPLDISEYELDAFTLLSLRGVFDPTTADQLWDRVLHHTAREPPSSCTADTWSSATPTLWTWRPPLPVPARQALTYA
jgi:hypothetical protein